MDLGKHITNINKKKNHLIISIILIISTLIFYYLIYENKLDDITNLNKIFIALGLFGLSLSSIILTYLNWPKNSYILFQKGIIYNKNSKENIILFKDISDIIIFPQISNIGYRIHSLAFKTHNSNWMIIGTGHKRSDIYKFKETYENYIYYHFVSKFNNSEDITFKYIDTTILQNNKIILKKDIYKILNNFDNSNNFIKINKNYININSQTYNINHISKVQANSLYDNTIKVKENTIFKFNKYSISNEDIFRMILNQNIRNNNDTYL